MTYEEEQKLYADELQDIKFRVQNLESYLTKPEEFKQLQERIGNSDFVKNNLRNVIEGQLRD